MITLIKKGSYKLVETKTNVKILYLDNLSFAWVEPMSISEMLILTDRPHKIDCNLAMGHYVLTGVDDEPYLTDLQHLELEYGRNAWQGYLLPTGLPTTSKKRGRIIPMIEIITGNPRFTAEMGYKK